MNRACYFYRVVFWGMVLMGSCSGLYAVSRLEQVFLQAAQSGNEESLKNVFDRFEGSFDPNVQFNPDKDGFNALHFAALQGHNNLIDLLVKNGVNINATDAVGRTPLYLAVIKQFPDTVRVLLEHGANVNIGDKEGDGKGRSPLLIAVAEKNIEIVQLLRGHGAQVYGFKNKEGNNAFHLAAYESNPKMADALLKQYRVPKGQPEENMAVAFSQKNNKGDTPVIVAAKMQKSKDFYDLFAHYANTVLPSHTASPWERYKGEQPPSYYQEPMVVVQHNTDALVSAS